MQRESFHTIVIVSCMALVCLAMGLAAGLAKAGMKPVVAIYSTFLQRGLDQVFQEASLQGLPIVFCMDRAGLVGSDGAVHHGFLDIALLRGLPGMTLMAPADADDLAAALRCALSLPGPSAIRYPRDQAPAALTDPATAFEPGRARTLRSGDDGAFLCYGPLAETALAVMSTPIFSVFCSKEKPLTKSRAG